MESSPAVQPTVALARAPEWERGARRARLLAWTSLAWLGFEGIATVLAGAIAGSIALVANGLDSGIEALASMIIVWRFTGSRTLSVAPSAAPNSSSR
jgi:hypothetical protein